MNIQTTENLRIFWEVHPALPIGAVITVRNILTPLPPFVETMPINKASASRKENRLFTV
jgi:hypothetical protein